MSRILQLVFVMFQYFGEDLFELAGFTVAGVKGLDQVGATLAWEACLCGCVLGFPQNLQHFRAIAIDAAFCCQVGISDPFVKSVDILNAIRLPRGWRLGA